MSVKGFALIDLQALDANDEPIPDLFNVGTMIGDFYSGVYTFAMEGMNYGAACITCWDATSRRASSTSGGL